MTTRRSSRALHVALECSAYGMCVTESYDQTLSSLAALPLHKEEESGTVPLLELFCWNAINIRKRLLTHALRWHANHCTWAARSTLCTCVPGEHAFGSRLHITVMLRPQILHIHVPQDKNLATRGTARLNLICLVHVHHYYYPFLLIYRTLIPANSWEVSWSELSLTICHPQPCI